jgi:hypothetical protein
MDSRRVGTPGTSVGPTASGPATASQSHYDNVLCESQTLKLAAATSRKAGAALASRVSYAS